MRVFIYLGFVSKVLNDTINPITNRIVEIFMEVIRLAINRENVIYQIILERHITTDLNICVLIKVIINLCYEAVLIKAVGLIHSVIITTELKLCRYLLMFEDFRNGTTVYIQIKMVRVTDFATEKDF